MWEGNVDDNVFSGGGVWGMGLDVFEMRVKVVCEFCFQTV